MTKTEKLIQELDDIAEGANYHGMVGAAEKLARIITKHSNEDVALKVLRDLKKDWPFES